MKNCLKVFTLLALVALLFTACGESKTTVYTAQTGVDGTTVQFIFNGDGTFVERCVISISGTTSIFEWYKGTYTGNPKIDGPLTLTFTHHYEDSTHTYALIDSYERTFTVSGGQFTYTWTFSRN